MAVWLEALLNKDPLTRIRRNHGLEHATLHVLSRKLPRKNLAGYSDARGYWIIGDVPTDVLQAAAQEALDRLRAGESNLAVHPDCGTNFVTSGVLAGVAGAAAMLGAGPRVRDKFERLSLAAMMATIVLILSRPLGFLLQANVTTSGKPGSMRIVQVLPSMRNQVAVHRVLTAG